MVFTFGVLSHRKLNDRKREEEKVEKSPSPVILFIIKQYRMCTHKHTRYACFKFQVPRETSFVK